MPPIGVKPNQKQGAPKAPRRSSGRGGGGLLGPVARAIKNTQHAAAHRAPFSSPGSRQGYYNNAHTDAQTSGRTGGGRRGGGYGIKRAEGFTKHHPEYRKALRQAAAAGAAYKQIQHAKNAADIYHLGQLMERTGASQQQKHLALSLGAANVMSHSHLLQDDNSIGSILGKIASDTGKSISHIPGTVEHIPGELAHTVTHLPQFWLHNLKTAADFVGDTPHRWEKVGKIAAALAAHPSWHNLMAQSQEGLKIAGPGAVPAALFTHGAPTLAANVKALTENPSAYGYHTAKGLRDMAIGVLPGLVESAQHPGKTLKALEKDYGKRYSGNYKEQLKRIRKQGGAAEAFDLVTALTAGDATIGRAALTGLKATGREGAIARAITRDRPMLRYGSGDATRFQTEAKGIGKRSVQALQDAARKARYEYKVRKADEKGIGHSGVQPGEGEVRPLMPGMAKAMRLKDIARVRARHILAMHNEAHREIHATTRKIINDLNKHERKGFALALKGLVPDDAHLLGNAERIVAHLTTLRDKIILPYRKAEDFTPAKVDADNVTHINDLLNTPGEIHRVFTPKLKDSIDQLHEVDRRVAANDPALATVQAELRRRAQQAELLGLRRGEQHVGSQPDAKLAQELAAHLEETHNPLAARIKARQEALVQLEHQHAAPERITALKDGIARDAAALKESAAHAQDLNQRLRVSAVPELRKIEETPEAFIQRVDSAARDAGLREPLYFRSELRGPANRADASIGGTAMSEDHAYGGKLFRKGIENLQPEVFMRGLQRSIKRRFNWNMVRTVFDRHAEHIGAGGTIDHVAQALKAAGRDPNEFAFWHPGRFNSEDVTYANAVEHGDAGAGSLADQGREAGVTASDGAQLKKGFEQATAEDLLSARHDGSTGWFAVPRDVYKEVKGEVNDIGGGSKLVHYGFDVPKMKFSRGILGGLVIPNIPWLKFQIESNFATSAIAMGGRLHHLVQAQWHWYRHMTPEERHAVEPYMGAVAGWGDPMMHGGEYATNSHLIDAFRGFKQWRSQKLWRQAALKLPTTHMIDGMFWLDRQQNTIFRRAVLYDHVKRRALHDMIRSADKVLGLEERVTHFLGANMHGRINEYLKSPKVLEEAGQHVSDMLGDYISFTRRERTSIARFPMFYGFLRYSLRLVFYTLPVKHPVVTSILGQLGRLHADEVRKLLGGAVPAYMLGRIYNMDHGQLESVDPSRANPLLDAITQMNKPVQAATLLPPPEQELVGQIFNQNPFTGEPYKINKRNTPEDPIGRGMLSGYGLGDRGRIALNDFLSAASPAYRIAFKRLHPEKQGADSLLWDPRPTKYSRADVVAKKAAEAAAHRRETSHVGHTILQELFPEAVPRISDDADTAKFLRDYVKNTLSKEKHKGSGGRKKAGIKLPSSSGGGIKLGGSSGGIPGVKIG